MIGTTASLFGQASTLIRDYQARVSAAQSEQPHWVTPLVTVTPRLEQEVRSDFVHQYNTKGFTIWNYGNGKALELIPERHTELIFNVPPFFNRSNGASDGFGDASFLAKYRFYSRNEEHGNAIVTAFVAGSIPTGKNANGSCCAIVTPTLAVGKGFGQLALTSTAGGSLPASNAKGLGHTITWNSTVQYCVAKTGLARFFWPEAEINSSFYKGGLNDGKIATFVTPGLIVGRIPLTHDASGKPGAIGPDFWSGSADRANALPHLQSRNRYYGAPTVLGDRILARPEWSYRAVLHAKTIWRLNRLSGICWLLRS